MQTETLIESQAKVLPLRADQADALRRVGRRLASSRTWWGDQEPTADRTVIQCTPNGPDSWRVKVVDAVGLIAVSDLEISVQPKIPLLHLLFLFAKSGHFPRLDYQRVGAAIGPFFWELVATWYVQAAELLLRRELVRDYHYVTEDIESVRGSLACLETTRSFYAGRVGFNCTYEDFGFDTPLNRVVLAGARTVASSRRLGRDTRRRALRVLARMEEVGEIRVHDLRTTLDRRTGHYRDAFGLARHVLLAEGRALGLGKTEAWTFLIRTPEMVEAGIRNLLQEHLGSDVVRKKGIQVPGSQLKFIPDLRFGHDLAVADVKYKLAGEDWNRPDLYQILAFATAVGSSSAAIVNFGPPESRSLASVQIGGIHVQHLAWCADHQLDPAAAAQSLCTAVGLWISRLRDRSVVCPE